MKLEVDAKIERASGFTLDVAVAVETDALGVTGPSGSGKSTFLDVIAGIEGGRVIVDDRDLTGHPIHRRGIGYVGQDALLFPHLSVAQNIAYSPRADRPREIAAALGIDHLLDRRPRNLSGGERRRVALARAIASKPALMLLDEPFSGLDEERRREAIELVREVRKRFGIPMVLVSHRADEVEALTDRRIRLENGRIATSSPV